MAGRTVHQYLDVCADMRHNALTFEVTRVRHDNSACLFEIVKRSGHFDGKCKR